MNRNNFWRFAFVVLVIAWSLYELYPPQGRDLVQVFRERADRSRRDTNFTAIVTKAQQLEKESPEKAYDNFVDAIGTNDITHYFPTFNATNQAHPNTYILNRLQREAAGKIHLGIDLQGGVSFLVEMDTNRLTQTSDARSALSHAVEVLRKRVDNLGVAEPVIQSQGNDRILVQMPGLSAAVQESAENSIKKAAFLEFRLVHPQSKELLEQGIIEPGYEVKKLKEKQRGGPDRY